MQEELTTFSRDAYVNASGFLNGLTDLRGLLFNLSSSVGQVLRRRKGLLGAFSLSLASDVMDARKVLLFFSAGKEYLLICLRGWILLLDFSPTLLRPAAVPATRSQVVGLLIATKRYIFIKLFFLIKIL